MDKIPNRRFICLSLISVLIGAQACASVPRTVCSDQDLPTRWTGAQIDAMQEHQVYQELTKNEQSYQKGCAIPNTR